MSQQNQQEQLVPRRDTQTQTHIHNVLNIIGCIMPALLNPWRDAEPIKGETLPGEARVAMENTLIEACKRLDKILSDEYRWDTKFQKELERKFEDAYKLQREYYENQSAAAKEISSPHARFRPQLGRTKDGHWVAVLGDLADPKAAIVGLGRTPEGALQAFDDAFRGEISPEMMQYALERERAIERDEPAPPAVTDTTHEKTLEQKRVGFFTRLFRRKRKSDSQGSGEAS